MASEGGDLARVEEYKTIRLPYQRLRTLAASRASFNEVGRHLRRTCSSPSKAKNDKSGD